jgi:hypothetical protein
MQTVIHIGWAWLILNEIVLVVFTPFFARHFNRLVWTVPSSPMPSVTPQILSKR